MNMKFLPFALLTFALSTPATADIFTYTDANGVVHLTNVPDKRQYKLVAGTQSSGNNPVKTSMRSPAQVSLAARDRFAPIVENAARAHHVDPALLHAVITAESGYNPSVVSSKGAVGLMQLMPETARRYGVENSFDPVQNIQGGTKYLSDLLQMFNYNIELAVAAYNAGENAVIRHGNSIPPYRETLSYVPKVLKLQKKYSSIL